MTDEQTAREAAEVYADKLFPCTKPCDSYGICEGCYERELFDCGRGFGRREGLEEAAEIARKFAKDYREAYSEDLCPSSTNIEDIAPDDRTRVAFRMGRFILDNVTEQLPQAIRAAINKVGGATSEVGEP